MFLVNSSDPHVKILRSEFQKALKLEGIIEDIFPENEEVKIRELSDASLLKEVRIKCLSNVKNVQKIWKINLETLYPGIATRSKTAESALLVLQSFPNVSKLNIILIELKSSIQPPKLKNDKLKEGTLYNIEEKIRSSINRLYMFLTLNNHDNPKKGYENKKILLQTYSFVFFNKNKVNEAESSPLKLILEKDAKGEEVSTPERIFTFQSIINSQEKILLYFFKNKNSSSNEIELDLSTII